MIEILLYYYKNIKLILLVHSMHLHDTMHSGPVLNFDFIPFYSNIVHRIVHVYASVFCTQPHGWLAFKVHRIRGVHSVRNAIVTGVLVVILFTRRAVGQKSMSTYTGTDVELPKSYDQLV